MSYFNKFALLITSTVFSFNVFATTVTFVGDGILEENYYTTTNIGTTTVSLTYDANDMSVSNTFSWSGGNTGTRWSLGTATTVSITDGSGTSYSTLDFGGVSMFDQPGSFDQFNLEDTNTNIIAQWNDSSSDAFGPISTDFLVEEANFLNALINVLSFELSNGGLYLNPIDGDYDRTIELNNAVVTVTTGTAVPAPLSIALFALGVFGLIRRRA